MVFLNMWSDFKRAKMQSAFLKSQFKNMPIFAKKIIWLIRNLICILYGKLRFSWLGIVPLFLLEVSRLSYTKNLGAFISQTCNADFVVCCYLPSDSDQKMPRFPCVAQTTDVCLMWEQEGEMQKTGSIGGNSLVRLINPHRAGIM